VPSAFLAYSVLSTPAPVPPPEGKRFPFGWDAFAVPPSGTVALPGPIARVEDAARLRLTVALDDREEKRIEVVAAASGQRLGEFDLRFADCLQMFEVPLPDNVRETVGEAGILLRMTQGATPLYIFTSTRGIPTSARVHVLTGEDARPVRDRFLEKLCSSDSLEPFGWHEGCVLDGLYDVSRRFPRVQAGRRLTAHLARFFDADRRLKYENPRSEPADGKIYGIEGTLPFAVIAKVTPDHPALDFALAFWRERREKYGAIIDGTTATAEGCYTVAYPLAVLSRIRRSDELARMALHELRVRRDRLPHRDALYLRHDAANDARTFRNWCRGVAWYLLGITRTLIELGDRTDTADLREELRRATKWTIAHQMPDGLWRCFLDERDTIADTFGSAGIGAAFALGARHGLLDATCRDAARRTLNGLYPYLTPDGFLTGCSQSNKGGEALQRSSYRVIKKTAMGLMAQLAAALEP
jgi:unsaturated rhamnogalacturonyl hydrolase